jgi:hypothetical protein
MWPSTRRHSDSLPEASSVPLTNYSAGFTDVFESDEALSRMAHGRRDSLGSHPHR